MTKEYRGEDETDSPDGKGAVESEVERTNVIKGDEVLGYDGTGREEHSGQNEPSSDAGLADNQPGQVPKPVE